MTCCGAGSERVQRLWRPGSGRGTAALALLLLAVAVWLASGYYQIGAAERGVVQRFGRYVAIEQPGHGWHWPWPIETMTKLNVASIEALDSKALMLTADQSLIDDQLVGAVSHRRSAAVSVSACAIRRLTLRQTSETVMRELVARARPAGAAERRCARSRVTGEARGRMQQPLDGYGAGISVTGVNLTDVQLPDAVLAAQRDAEKAAEDRRRAIGRCAGLCQRHRAEGAGRGAAGSWPMRRCTRRRPWPNAEGEAERFTQLANGLCAGAARSRAAASTSRPWRASCRARAQDHHRRQERQRQHDLSAARQAGRGGARGTRRAGDASAAGRQRRDRRQPRRRCRRRVASRRAPIRTIAAASGRSADGTRVCSLALLVLALALLLWRSVFMVDRRRRRRCARVSARCRPPSTARALHLKSPLDEVHTLRSARAHARLSRRELPDAAIRRR